MALGLTVFRSLICVCRCVCRNIWSLSMVSRDLPLLEVCRIFIISLIGPMEWLWSSRWVAKLDFLILYLKSWKCSLNRFRKDRPVWPTYFIWQSGHVRQYTPLCWYCWSEVNFGGLEVRILLMVLLVLRAILRWVSLKILVMVWVCFPKYVNFVHVVFSLVVGCLGFGCSSCLMIEVLYPLLATICSIICRSCFLFVSLSWYLCSLLVKYLIAACFCSDGWQDSAGIIISVDVGLRYILNENVDSVLCIVKSKKLMLCSDSFSKVNFNVGVKVLNIVCISFMSVRLVS
jgi:hypothetical protein